LYIKIIGVEAPRSTGGSVGRALSSRQLMGIAWQRRWKSVEQGRAYVH